MKAGLIAGGATGGVAGIASLTGQVKGYKDSKKRFEKKAAKMPMMHKAMKSGKTYQAAGNRMKDAKAALKMAAGKLPSKRSLKSGAGLATGLAAGAYGRYKLERKGTDAAVTGIRQHVLRQKRTDK